MAVEILTTDKLLADNLLAYFSSEELPISLFKFVRLGVKMIHMLTQEISASENLTWEILTCYLQSVATFE